MHDPDIHVIFTRVLRGIPNLVGLYLWNQLYAIDVLANTIIGGDRRETEGRQ